VETVQNQTAVLHSFHRPLEIANYAIPTFTQLRLRVLGKVENHKQVFHFPTAARHDDPFLLSLFLKPRLASLADTTALHSLSGGPN
jgi:hypothetical protein